MKNILIIFLITLFSFSPFVYAQEFELMSSSASTNGNGANIAFPNYEYTGIQYAYDYLPTGSPTTLISSSSPYTILGVRAFNQAGYVSYSNNLSCGENRDWSFFDYISSLASETSGASSFSDDNFIHCTTNAVYSQSGGSGIVVVAYVPYDTRILAVNKKFSKDEIYTLVMIGLIIFLIPLWRFMFRIRK